jgi:hypothetical protein
MIFFAIFGAALYSENIYLISISSGFISFSFYPTFAAILELGCETVFPIGEASSSGFIFAGGQLMSFILGLSLQSLYFKNIKNRLC